VPLRNYSLTHSLTHSSHHPDLSSSTSGTAGIWWRGVDGVWGCAFASLRPDGRGENATLICLQPSADSFRWRSCWNCTWKSYDCCGGPRGRLISRWWLCIVDSPAIRSAKDVPVTMSGHCMTTQNAIRLCVLDWVAGDYCTSLCRLLRDMTFVPYWCDERPVSRGGGGWGPWVWICGTTCGKCADPVTFQSGGGTAATQTSWIFGSPRQKFLAPPLRPQKASPPGHLGLQAPPHRQSGGKHQVYTCVNHLAMWLLWIPEDIVGVGASVAYRFFVSIKYFINNVVRICTSYSYKEDFTFKMCILERKLIDLTPV